MRLFDLSEGNTTLVNEVKWQYRIRLRDIFNTFQKGNLTLEKAKNLIIKRIEEFVKVNSTLDSNAKEAFTGLVDQLKATDDLDVIDQLIGNTLFDIADEFDIEVK